MPSKRAPLTQRCDLIRGPSHPDAGNRYRTGVPSRLVMQLEILPTDTVYNLRVAWLTLDFPAPAIALPILIGHTCLFDYDYADRVQMQDNPALVYIVLMVEIVSPPGTSGYPRAWLAQPGWT